MDRAEKAEGITDVAAVPVVVGLIVLIAIVLLLIQKSSAKFTRWLVIAEAVLAGGLGIVAKIEPTVLWWIGDLIWKLNFVSRAALTLVSLLVVVLIVRNVVDQALLEEA